MMHGQQNVKNDNKSSIFRIRESPGLKYVNLKLIQKNPWFYSDYLARKEFFLYSPKRLDRLRDPPSPLNPGYRELFFGSKAAEA